MRMSKLFSHTLREVPSEAEFPSHQLLLRAGFIRQLAAGVFSELPLARRSLVKIEAILRDEIDAIGGQEISMPLIQPASLWQETGRWYKIDAEMGRFKDRVNRDMVLGMTHEEVVADLARREIQSYRQLPQLVYQIQTKWRDDPRPRAGLIRAREFIMKDSYSLDVDWQGLDRQYRAHYQAYFNIFHRCGLPVIAVKADVGMMGGKLSHEYMYLTQYGEDTLLLCDRCGYSANRQVARFRKPAAAAEDVLPLDQVATPETKTIEDLAQFLSVPKSKTAKAVFMMATIDAPLSVAAGPAANQREASSTVDRFIFAIVRGDMEVNETKLLNTLEARALRPATEDEIRATGAVPGYASPVGLEANNGRLFTVVVDDAVPHSPNLVAGANVEGYHLRNTNFGRDYTAEIVTDIAAAGEGDICPECDAALRAVRGVEVGNIFQLGTFYSDMMGVHYVDANGQEQPVVMGSYGIGVGRLLASIAEAHHDDAGLIWPVTVAPFHVHLVLLAGKSKDSPTLETANRLYAELQSLGIEVLYDDRDESPGVKLNDADLIGLPLRVTIGERGLKNGTVELKRRKDTERRAIPLDELGATLQSELASLYAEIQATVVPVPYIE